MPIYLRDLVDKPDLLRNLRQEEPRCCECGIVLHETTTGKRQTPKGESCSDCYYELLGEEIENHPIASAGIRRG